MVETHRTIYYVRWRRQLPSSLNGLDSSANAKKYHKIDCDEDIMAQRVFDAVHALRIKNNCFLKCFSYMWIVSLAKCAWLNGVDANWETIHMECSNINSCATTFDVSLFSLSVLSICHDENAWRKNAIEWKSAAISLSSGVDARCECLHWRIYHHVMENWRCRFIISVFHLFQFFFRPTTACTAHGMDNGTEIWKKKNQKNLFHI